MACGHLQLIQPVLLSPKGGLAYTKSIPGEEWFAVLVLGALVRVELLLLSVSEIDRRRKTVVTGLVDVDIYYEMTEIIVL